MSVKSGRSDELFETRLNDAAAMEDVDGSALEAYAQAIGAKPRRGLVGAEPIEVGVSVDQGSK